MLQPLFSRIAPSRYPFGCSPHLLGPLVSRMPYGDETGNTNILMDTLSQDSGVLPFNQRLVNEITVKKTLILSEVVADVRQELLERLSKFYLCKCWWLADGVLGFSWWLPKHNTKEVNIIWKPWRRTKNKASFRPFSPALSIRNIKVADAKSHD